MTRDPARSHGVLLLLGDGPEDVVAAREAAALAAEAGTRVLAGVVLPTIDAAGDPAAVAAGTLRRRREADAVGGRVRPLMDAHHVPLTAVPLLLPVGWSVWTPWRLRRAVRLLARRCGAQHVVVPPRRMLGLPAAQVAAMVPGGLVAPPVPVPLPASAAPRPARTPG